MKNIIFVGGIHGVGKGTFCREICEKFDFEHLSASKVLKWEEISRKENKRVENLDLTQNRLLKGLDMVVKSDLKYLLDGHFCLLNKDGVPEKVSEKTFSEINPKAIVLITGEIDVLLNRLVRRDNTEYNSETLIKMSELELFQAKKIATELDIPFFKLENEDYNQFYKFLKEYESFN